MGGASIGWGRGVRKLEFLRATVWTHVWRVRLAKKKRTLPFLAMQFCYCFFLLLACSLSFSEGRGDEEAMKSAVRYLSERFGDLKEHGLGTGALEVRRRDRCVVFSGPLSACPAHVNPLLLHYLQVFVACCHLTPFALRLLSHNLRLFLPSLFARASTVGLDTGTPASGPVSWITW